MTFTQFMAKYNGKYVDMGGSENAKNQCVDEANAYLSEVLGQPAVMWTNAKDFPSKLLPPLWEYIQNTPLGVPKEEDLIIWGGTYGHIANFIEGDVNSFRSFDQNYPVGSPCHVQNHTYSNVLGWLRFKGVKPSTPEELKACQTALAEETKKKQDNWNWGNELQHELEGAKAQIISHENNLKAIASTLNTSPEMPKIMGEITKLMTVEDELRKTKENLEKQRVSITEMAQKLTECENKYNGAIQANKQQTDMITAHEKTIVGLTENLEELQKIINDTTTHESLFSVGKLSICKITGNAG